MHQYRLSIERLSYEQQQIEIDRFLDCGWDYIGNSKLADVHVFAVFQWNKDCDPILPQGYERCRTSDPIHCDGFV